MFQTNSSVENENIERLTQEAQVRLDTFLTAKYADRMSAYGDLTNTISDLYFALNTRDLGKTADFMSNL